MTMNKGKAIIYVALGAAILIVFTGAMFTGDWFMDMNGDSPKGPVFDDVDPDAASINYQLFNTF
ncbi:MAG: hypothetical protein LBE47_01190, partial [Methanomassiliicoccaceae archaeon]|nr:hypothetical protein [Methanomassiliicoccaceae archaeon]